MNLLCTAINDIHTNYLLQINWYKGNELIRQKQKRILIYNIENVISRQLTSSLLFDPIKYADDGEYTCRAFNHPDSYSEAKTTLTVECEVATIHNYMHTYIHMYIHIYTCTYIIYIYTYKYCYQKF